MKKIYCQVLLLGLALIALVSCKKDNKLSHTNVSPVAALYAPANNFFMNLNAQSSAVFEWEAAKAEDNGVVLYDVVFDKENGDFSNPVYTVPSDGKGLQRTLTLTFAELSRIAGMAGIQAEEVGKLKWTVVSSKGMNVRRSEVSRMIEVERPAGFPAPDQLFITGSATEGGADLSKALMMKKTSPNSFEIYTSLKDGEYSFAERNTGTPATYYIDNGKLKAEGKTTVSGGTKVYRIRLDFSTANTEMTEIETIGLWFAPDNKFLFELGYTANGTWETKDASIVFKQESWGRDERYKFRMKTKKADGSSADEWYGSVNRDNQRPTSTTAASYWHMTPVTNDRWDNCFKFNGDVDNKLNDVKVIFNGSVPQYTHSVTVK